DLLVWYIRFVKLVSDCVNTVYPYVPFKMCIIFLALSSFVYKYRFTNRVIFPRNWNKTISCNERNFYFFIFNVWFCDHSANCEHVFKIILKLFIELILFKNVKNELSCFVLIVANGYFAFFVKNK